MARPGGDAQRGPHPRAELGSGAGDPRGAPRRTPTEPEVLTVSRATTRWAGRVPSRLCRPFAAPTAALAGPTRSLGEAGPCPGQHPPFLPGPRAPRGRRGRQGGLGPQRNQPDDGSQPPPTPPEGLTRRHGPQLQTPPGPVQSELPPRPPTGLDRQELRSRSGLALGFPGGREHGGGRAQRPVSPRSQLPALGRSLDAEVTPRLCAVTAAARGWGSGARPSLGEQGLRVPAPCGPRSSVRPQDG